MLKLNSFSATASFCDLLVVLTIGSLMLCMFLQSMLKNMAHKLPDGGANLRALREQLLARLRQMKKPVDIAAMQQRLQLSSAPASRPGFARILTNNVVEQLHRCE